MGNSNFDPNIGKATQFKKGITGNPNGRNGSISDIIKKMGKSKKIEYTLKVENSKGEEKIIKGKITATGGRKATINDLLSAQLFQNAIRGDIKAMDMIMDRTEGKPIQTNVELDPIQDPLSEYSEGMDD